jgi:hypothetical protein
MGKNYMAIDQYGNTEHNLGTFPRKELCKRVGTKHVDKMYVDSKDGKSYWVGYIIGNHWFNLFSVEPLRVERK